MQYINIHSLVMNYKPNQFLKLLCSILLFSFVLQAKAQYPVQVTTQLISPYSLNLSDYYTGTLPKMYVTLTNKDFQHPIANVRLRMFISSSSV
ncbi:MAG: hypothetical protein RIQ33_200, partial [Bacteroidota bacterium]